MMERGLVAYWNGDLVDIYIYIYIIWVMYNYVSFCGSI